MFDSIDKALTTYSSVNAIISPMVWLQDATLPLVAKYISDAWWVKGLYASTAYNAAFVTTFRGASHLADNYLNPAGITKTIGNGFFEQWLKVGLLFSPFYTMAANGIPQIAFNNFYVPKITPQGILPNYIGRFVAPTFAAGALPVGFALGMLENGKSPSKPYGAMAPQPAH